MKVCVICKEVIKDDQKIIENPNFFDTGIFHLKCYEKKIKKTKKICYSLLSIIFITFFVILMIILFCLLKK